MTTEHSEETDAGGDAGNGAGTTSDTDPSRDSYWGVSVAKDVIDVARQKQITLSAAGIAYYTIAALVPAVILSFVVARLIAGEDVAQLLLVTVEDWIAPEGQEIVQDIILETRGLRGITVFGTAFLAWSVYRVMNGLDVALSQIYDREFPESLAERLSDYLLLVILMTLSIAVTTVVATEITTYPTALSSGITGSIGQLVALTILFLPLYYVLSGPEHGISSSLPGAVLTAAGWTVLQALYSIYVQYFTTTVYELFGGLLLFLTWLYLGIVVLLIGAAVNVALHRHR